MPELPEAETIRRGLEPYVKGKRIAAVRLFHPRVARFNPEGLDGILNLRIEALVRRGKYLWFLFPGSALVVHLRMSGQFRIGKADSPHLRARLTLSDGTAVSFVDQRTFGYLHLDCVAPAADGFPAGCGSDSLCLPVSVRKTARDLLDPAVNLDRLAAEAKKRRRAVKSLLLAQDFVSGIGNIYADEALWAARINGGRRADTLSLSALHLLFAAAREIMKRSIDCGGTSFDKLYVNVSGRAGYFAQSLNAYGRSGQPCLRCGTLLVKEPFMGRSSTYCPQCQSRRKEKDGS